MVKLMDPPFGWTLGSLGEELGLSKSAVHRSIDRLYAARLYDPARRRVRVASAEEFIRHGVPYAFPVALGGETRGVPTAWADGMVRGLAPSDAPDPVWPHPMGQRRGAAVEPLDAIVPEAAARDENLHRRLALVDAI